MEEYGHLVLTREPSQMVRIGEVTVKVVRVRGKYVKLAIRAPKTMGIQRGELESSPDETVSVRKAVANAEGWAA